MFEKAKQKLIDEFDGCHLKVLAFIRATHPDNSDEAIVKRLKQFDRLCRSYNGKVPAEQMAHLICAWASDEELDMYAKMQEPEKLVVIITLCVQCRKLKDASRRAKESFKKGQELRNVMFSLN